jgi:hypothetical protein
MFRIAPRAACALGETHETAGVHWAYWRCGGNAAGSYPRAVAREATDHWVLGPEHAFGR